MPKALRPSRKHSIHSVQMTLSQVRLGQSFKTVGYGYTSCWGDVGAGDVEADVIYITFIVSVQYSTETRYKDNVDNWTTGQLN